MKIFRIVTVLVMTSFLFFSCSDDFANGRELSEKAYITLDFVSARTVLPEFELSKLSNIVLKGSRNGAEEEMLARYVRLPVAFPSGGDIEVDVGNWNFTLTAKQGNTSFSGIQSKKIEPGKNSLSFTLSVVDFGDVTDVGSVKVSLEFPADAGDVYVKAGLFDISGKNQISGFEPESVEITGAKVVYEKTVVPVGQYLLKFNFYGDADGKAYINTYKEIVKVASGCTSAAERSVDTLNEVYQISLELNGGELVGGTSIPAAYTRNSEKIVLPNVSTLRKDGYVLDGIYETPDFAGERINEISPEDEKSYSLYAKWNRGVVITADEISSLDLTTQTEEIEIAVYGEVTSEDIYRLGKKVEVSAAGINLNLLNTKGLKRIDDYTFENCNSLTAIGIPLSLTTMGYMAFYNCDKIEAIDYEGTASQWCNIDFGEFPSLTKPDATSFYCNGKLLVNIILDSTVTRIPDSAFKNNQNIKTVEISESVTRIGVNAFMGCSNLESLVFKDPLQWYSTLKRNYVDGSLLDVLDAAKNAHYFVYQSFGQCFYKKED